MSFVANLVSTQNHVESPFIIVRIGDYTFGHCASTHTSKLQTTFKLTHPNYMESLNVVKVNGSINTYVLTMTYAITQNDDPNLLEKVFSKISDTRTIYISYGDWNAPSFIYKEEKAVITKLTTRVNMQNSTIQYIVNCTSDALTITAGSFSFSAVKAKPSTVLISLLENKNYGLMDIFTGMRNKAPSTFIDTSDKEVQLEAKNCSILDYIGYLVNCMVWSGDDSTKLKTACYFWAVYDDVSNIYGGSYFKVTRVQANTPVAVSYNTYELDVGYPSAACVTNFTINDDESWSLLYNHAGKINIPQYSYSIDDSGNLLRTDVNILTNSRLTYSTNENTRNWWSLVTQFPIKATVTIKGLLRPSILMSYVKVNTYFYGHKHISSGLYIITRQEDSISKSGYRTTLNLTRVGGDEYYA